MHVFLYIYICKYAYMCVDIEIFRRTHTHIHIHIYHVYIYTSLYIYMCTYTWYLLHAFSSAWLLMQTQFPGNNAAVVEVFVFIFLCELVLKLVAAGCDFAECDDAGWTGRMVFDFGIPLNNIWTCVNRPRVCQTYVAHSRKFLDSALICFVFMQSCFVHLRLRQLRI